VTEFLSFESFVTIKNKILSKYGTITIKRNICILLEYNMQKSNIQKSKKIVAVGIEKNTVSTLLISVVDICAQNSD